TARDFESEPCLAPVVAKIDIASGQICDGEVRNDGLVGDVLQSRELQLHLNLSDSAAGKEPEAKQRPARLHENVNYRKAAWLHRRVLRRLALRFLLFFFARDRVDQNFVPRGGDCLQGRPDTAL